MKQVHILAVNWETIAAEAAVLDHGRRLEISRDAKTHEEVAAEIIAAGRAGWVQAWRPGWWNWGICVNDQFPVDCEMPQTVALLREAGGIKAAALSLFEPGCTLPVHQHFELEGRYLTYHLGLCCPKDGAGLVIGNALHRERDGRWFIFDGSRTHYAFNCSDRERVILYVEFEREVWGW